MTIRKLCVEFHEHWSCLSYYFHHGVAFGVISLQEKLIVETQTQLHGNSWLVSARRSFQVSAPKFSVVGARKKYFLMNFRFRKVFAPLSAVREKSTGFRHEHLLWFAPLWKCSSSRKTNPEAAWFAATFGGADQASSKEVVPLTVQFCSFILHDRFHPSLTHPSSLAFCAP